MHTPAGDPSFDVSVEMVDGQPVVVFRGELDMSAKDEIGQCMDEVRASGRPVVVDLADTTFMDSAGVNTLLKANLDHGDGITLRSPSAAVLRTLALAGLETFFRVE